MLSALESLVPDTPEAVEDLERLRALERPLTDPGSGATKRLHDEQRAEPGDAAMTEVLGALRHPTRRKLMDDIGSRPGASLNEIAGPYPTSRAALGKHLAVLERAGLVLSRREGRRRRLYINRVPIQLVYDRWTTRFVAPLAQHVAATKYAVEGGGR
ncbi:MAG: helix-turn-helix domain-containing protein [Myxococcota bacterium]